MIILETLQDVVVELYLWLILLFFGDFLLLFYLTFFVLEEYKVICKVDCGLSLCSYLCSQPPSFFFSFCPTTPAGCWLHNEYHSPWAEWEGKSKASKRKCHHQLPPGLSTRPGNHRFDLNCLYHMLEYTNLPCKQLLPKMSRAECDSMYMTYIWFCLWLGSWILALHQKGPSIYFLLETLMLWLVAGGNAYGKMVQVLNFTRDFLDFDLHSPKT